MTKITADQLARQGRAAFVTATHTLRGKSGKESPGDKSFIPAKGIKLTKIGERSNSNVAYADERDTPACSVTRFLWSNACPPCLAEASQFITFVGFQRHGLGVPPHVAAINYPPDSDNSELVLPMKVAKKKGWAA
jgi:hypothetical protein